MRKILFLLLLLPALARAEGFYWGLNASQYQPHTEVMFGNLITLENNENAEMAFALIGGYEMAWWLNPEASYRKLANFGYQATRAFGQSAVANYDVTLLTIANVVKFDNGARLRGGLYQHTTDGTITAGATFGIPSGPKQSSEWGMFYGAGYEFKVKKTDVRLDLDYFPAVGNQEVLGAEGDALLLGLTILFR